MFVNKMKTPSFIVTAILCLATVFSAMMPFYVFAQESEKDLDGEMICAEGGEYLRLVNLNSLNKIESLEKPLHIVLNNRGEKENYFVEEMDCMTFLESVGLDVNDNDIVTVSTGAYGDIVLEDKAVVSVDTVEYKTETRTETVKYGTDEIGIDTIPKGSRELVSEGKDGSATRTYLVKYVNGKPAEEAIYSEIIHSEAVNEVVNVGIGGTVTAKDGTVYEYNYRKQMEATAYTYLPPYTTMTTATGQTLRKGIVAVDPRVIPLHTRMFITGSVEYGLGVAEDTGGAIKGNIVDLAYMSYDECIQFGRRQMQVYILD